MLSEIPPLFLGTSKSRGRRYQVLLLAAGTFIVSFAAYASGVFFASGGLVWIPYHSALVGMLAACWIGYKQDGLVFGWLVTYTSFLGFRADHAMFGISRRPFVERLAYFVRLDGLTFLAVEAIVLGTLAFGVGTLVRRGVDRYRAV